MRCSGCGSENPADAKFCTECGQAFTIRCRKCNRENPIAARFCKECGTYLMDVPESRATGCQRWRSNPSLIRSRCAIR
ncbi:MAG: double zinc ribbon domain-containing protein [Candidatus Binataceae bacterium]